MRAGTALEWMQNFSSVSSTQGYPVAGLTEGYENLLLAAASAATAEQQVVYLKQAEQQLIASASVLPLYSAVSYCAVQKEVQGLWIYPQTQRIYFKYAAEN